MPQLDIATFSTQYFWLVLSFGTFFLCLVRWFLPSMARVLAYRANAPNAIDENSEQGSTTALSEESSFSEQDLAFQGMQSAIQTTQRDVPLPQEIENAVYASTAIRSQDAWTTECTLMQTEGIAHTTFGQGSPVVAKMTTRALLKILQERLR